jgi:putative ABC transport system permease protein
MTFRDIISLSAGNLWRLKLRSVLTILGVVIAIGAFVSMLSFGAGNQKYITSKFNKLGLFWTMQVFTRNAQSDSSNASILDDKAIERLSNIPGVNLAYPLSTFPVALRLADTTIETNAQALTIMAAETKLFSGIRAGHSISSDSSHEALISDELLTMAGVTNPDTLIGSQITITVKVASIDSALMHILVDKNESFRQRLENIRVDSLKYGVYRRRVIRGEINSAVQRFINGYLYAREAKTDTFTIVGIMENNDSDHLRIEKVIIPARTAKYLKGNGFTGDPAQLLESLNSGFTLFPSDDASMETYASATLDLNPRASIKMVKDSVEAMGFKAFSFAEQFDEVRKFFLYFDLGLGIISFIALITASLGIINTMFMSILERKKEIGLLKSLGAEDKEIRYLFLSESAIIGAVGAVGGILLGWIVSRTASIVVKKIMIGQGLPETELFATPPWLILCALGIGIGISLLAGIYPASRAARIDPVISLRNE